MVLVRHLLGVPLYCNDALALSSPWTVPASADFMYVEPLHLSTLARPKAALPALPSAKFL